MSSNEIAQRVAQPITPITPATPGRIGQGTAVEQSRAIAEVQGAIVVAQQCPRSVPNAVASMEESFQQIELAQRSFYRYARAGQQITGLSVHAARELARCWGNVQYGEVELRRDDEYGQSEMQAFAWDVQTNTRAVRTFIVPHTRDTREGTKRLTEARDVYEMNANQAARRLRETIFAVLPPWFVERAKNLALATLSGSGKKNAKPLATRVADAIKVYGELGVSAAQLETKQGREPSRWTEMDLATLLVIYQSIQHGETTVELEFAPEPVRGAEIIGKDPERTDGQVPGQRPAPEPNDDAGQEPPADEPPADDIPVEDPPAIDGDGWGDVEVAKPGSGTRRRNGAAR